MRINELLEGSNFKDDEFLKIDGDKREIDFDLPEDLLYFMNNDDDVYRRHLFPLVSKCLHSISVKKPVNPLMFKPAVHQGYKVYIKKYPIRELPDELDDKVCNEVSKKMHEVIVKHVKEGKHKD